MVSTGPLRVASKYRPWYRHHLWSMVMLLALCSHSHLVQGQTFDSGSTGADGALGGDSSTSSVFDGGGGGGSGGAIHLLAPVVNIAGTLSGVGGARGNGGNPSTVGGGDDGGVGASGRIRVEAFQRQITSTITPPPLFTTPFSLFLTPTASLRVVSIAGVPVPPNPTGSFTMPDVTIDETAAVDVEIEAHNVPPGTIVQLYLFSESEADQIIDAPPLVGTLAQ